MQSTRTFWIITINLIIVLCIALVQPFSPQFGYILGSIYVGVFIGASLAIFVRPFDYLRSETLQDIFTEIRQRNHRRRYFSLLKIYPEQWASLFVTSALFMLITLINDGTFFGEIISENPIIALVTLALAGIFIGFINTAMPLWFDSFIWQGKLIYDVIAVGALSFLISMVGAFWYLFFTNLLFTIVFGSRAIVVILIYRFNFDFGQDTRHYALITLVFVLFLPLIYRL